VIPIIVNLGVHVYGHNKLVNAKCLKYLTNSLAFFLDAFKDILKANNELRRRAWLDRELRTYIYIHYQGPDFLASPEAKEVYNCAARCKFKRYCAHVIVHVYNHVTERDS